jgi:hypothetical protein
VIELVVDCIDSALDEPEPGILSRELVWISETAQGFHVAARRSTHSQRLCRDPAPLAGVRRRHVGRKLDDFRLAVTPVGDPHGRARLRGADCFEERRWLLSRRAVHVDDEIAAPDALFSGLAVCAGDDDARTIAESELLAQGGRGEDHGHAHRLNDLIRPIWRDEIEAADKATSIYLSFTDLPQEVKDFIESLIRSNFKLEKEIQEYKTRSYNNG